METLLTSADKDKAISWLLGLPEEKITQNLLTTHPEYIELVTGFTRKEMQAAPPHMWLKVVIQEREAIISKREALKRIHLLEAQLRDKLTLEDTHYPAGTCKFIKTFRS